jgi:hypothetical protein
LGDAGRKQLVKQFGNIVDSPYVSYGAVLGCEYVEKERYGGRGGERYRERGGFTGLVRLGAPSLMLGRPFETIYISDLRAVMVRYVFLIPPETNWSRWSSRRGRADYFRQMADGRQEPALGPWPLRSHIKTQMIENMEHIEARIKGRRVER